MTFENLQEHFKCLQINTNAALVIKAIIQDIGHATDGTSTLSSFSSSPSTLPSSPPPKFELHIGTWVQLAKRVRRQAISAHRKEQARAD